MTKWLGLVELRSAQAESGQVGSTPAGCAGLGWAGLGARPKAHGLISSPEKLPGSFGPGPDQSTGLSTLQARLTPRWRALDCGVGQAASATVEDGLAFVHEGLGGTPVIFGLAAVLVVGDLEVHAIHHVGAEGGPVYVLLHEAIGDRGSAG